VFDDMKFLAACGGLFFLLFASAAQAADESVTVEGVKDFPEDCKLIRQAALPFNWVNGQMVVEVTLNDHPLHFAVDTGAVFSAIDHTVAKGIGLGQGPLGFDYTIKDSGGADIRNITRIDDIKFGSLKTGSLTLVSVALPKGEDGILAPDLLRNFDVEFDPAHQVINLFKPHSCDAHVVYWTSDFVKLQATQTDQARCGLRYPSTACQRGRCWIPAWRIPSSAPTPPERCWEPNPYSARSITWRRKMAAIFRAARSSWTASWSAS
jgi:hypothetical protein